MAILKLKNVDNIEGNFFVPSYQRGYRWTKEEVTRLLNDIYNLLDQKNINSVRNSKDYCLQPIVVEKIGENNFSVIDGQQRLTTIFILYKFMNSETNFTLNYETRKKSAEFLENMDLNLQEDNIDFYFMANAYRSIENWFNEKMQYDSTNLRTLRRRFENLFTENVKIIWYEVDGTEDGAALFTRLNIGKIPLTNAELVKAMFLSRSNKNIDANKQQEIALQWDNLEKELHNDSLWYFLTNEPPEKYQTRIDLILNLIAGKKSDEKDVYSTFFYFNDLREEKNLDEVWLDIRKTFLLLKDWHEDHEFYHKIGYLIASDYKNISDIYKESKDKTTTEFKRRLDKIICDSVKLGENESYSDWNYNENKDKIRRLLLLFNVESVRQNSEKAYWFPFDKFKFVDDKKAAWSLEHIHALKTDERKGIQENWREWLKLHKESLESLETSDTNLIEEIKKLLDKKEFRYEEFSKLQDKILEKFSPNETDEDYANSIANLALLKCSENSALSNSTFDVKRNSIIKMDMHGEFIPFCTKMAFLKYYTKSEKNQIHFWSKLDRDAYLAAINDTLKEYLTQPI